MRVGICPEVRSERGDRIVMNKETGRLKVRKFRGENSRAETRIKFLSEPGSPMLDSNRGSRRIFWSKMRRVTNDLLRRAVCLADDSVQEAVFPRSSEDWMPRVASRCGAVTVTSGRIFFHN